MEGERSPPLYYALAWLWAQPFGLGEVGLRSLSALVGTLMIPAAFLLGRELASTRTGLIGAALVALNPILVWYSQEARSYILMALLVTVAMIYFARGMRRPEPTSLALWAAFSALALCSHYFAIFLIAPQAILLLLASRNRAVVFACGGLSAVVLALGLVALGQQGEDRRDGYTDLSLASRVAEVGVDYVAGEEPDPLSASTKVDAVQVGAGVGGVGPVRGRRRAAEQRPASRAGGRPLDGRDPGRGGRGSGAGRPCRPRLPEAPERDGRGRPGPDDRCARLLLRARCASGADRSDRHERAVRSEPDRDQRQCGDAARGLAKRGRRGRRARGHPADRGAAERR